MGIRQKSLYSFMKKTFKNIIQLSVAATTVPSFSLSLINKQTIVGFAIVIMTRRNNKMQSVVQRQFVFFILVIVTFSTSTTAATSSLSQFVNLIPFDVSIVLVSDSATATKVDTATVTTLVTSDLTVCIQNISSSSHALDQILLESIKTVEARRRRLTKNYVATFKGVSIWKTNINTTNIPDATTVAGYEVSCLTTARTRLLTSFTNETDTASGLGSAVVDVRATINPNADTTTDTQPHLTSPHGTCSSQVYAAYPLLRSALL